MSTKLSVNLNAVAMLRNRRDLPWPSVVHMGRVALKAGAHGLTVHPRPDERHIRFSDLPDLRALIDDEFPEAEFNMEGYPSEEFLVLCEKNQPEQVTLVPDDPAQSTSDHGWDFIKHADLLAKSAARLKAGGFRVSLFCDPDASKDMIDAAKQIGADRLELYTGPYGACFDDADEAKNQLALLKRTSDYTIAAGMGLNAGHDLTVNNLPALIKLVPEIAEVSIGHGLTAEALEFGMAEAVQRFNKACKG